MQGGPPRPSGNDAWLPSWISSGLAWSLYRCAALWRAVYCSSATKRPLGTTCIREEKGVPVASGFLSHRGLNLAVESDIKTNPFLPFAPVHYTTFKETSTKGSITVIIIDFSMVCLMNYRTSISKLQRVQNNIM